MTFIRFSPEEYRTLARLFDSSKLDRKPLHILKQRLIRALTGTLPALLERIRRFRGAELRILQSHFLEQRQTPAPHGLSDDELDLLTEAFGPFLFQVRYLRPLRHALVRHFQYIFPDFATKLSRLSHRQFEELCGLAKARAKKSD